MTAEQMLYEFELSADKVSSKNAMNLSLPAKVAYLNRGQLSLVLTHYGGNNLYHTGFEETRKRTEDLQVLVQPIEVLSTVRQNDNLYYADLTTTSEKFLILLRHKAYGTKGNCKTVSIKTREVQLDDLEEALSDPFRKPDFRWREALLTTADNKLFIHTDGFKVEKLEISYLRYPRAIDVAGYINFDNQPSADVASELPEHLHMAIVRQATLEFKADVGDPTVQSVLLNQSKDE